MAEGEFALVTDRLTDALALSGQPVKRGTMAHEHIVYMMVVDALAASEDCVGIAAHAPRLVELAGRDEHAPYLAVARRALGVANRLMREYDEAETQLAAALALFEERGMDWQAGRTLFELGKLQLARDQHEAAGEFFSRALEAFERIGARPSLERTRMALEAVRETD